MLCAMGGFGWLIRLWNLAEPAERLDWVLEKLGFRERARRWLFAAAAGVIMFIVQRALESPWDWTVLIVILIFLIILSVINQLNDLSAFVGLRKNLLSLNPEARPSVRFFSLSRIARYVIPLTLFIIMLSITKGPNGIELPWYPCPDSAGSLNVLVTSLASR
jgi:hypothetical protein